MSKVIDIKKIQPDHQVDQPTENKDAEMEKIVKCPSCNGYVFINAMVLRKISNLESPTGKAGVSPVQGILVCFNCGKVMKEEDLGLSNETSGLIVTP